MKTDSLIARLTVKLLTVLIAGHLLFACAHAPVTVHPQFSMYHQPMDEVLLLVPEVTIIEKMPDGSQLLDDSKSHQTQLQIHDAIVHELTQRSYTVRTADPRLMQTPEIKNITSLFKSVNRSIQLHTFGPQPYPDKIRSFEYDMGPVADILRSHQADGLVLGLGYQAGSDRQTSNWLSVALVEPRGRIIWYGIFGNHPNYNFYDEQGTSAIVARALAGLREKGT